MSLIVLGRNLAQEETAARGAALQPQIMASVIFRPSLAKPLPSK